MRDRDHIIPAFHDAHGVKQVTLSVRTARDGYALSLQLPDEYGMLVAEAGTCFAALQGLRKQAELAGWRICVQGARRNAYASGFCISMANGFKAYLFELGTKPSSSDVVDTLAPDEPAAYSTVPEQNEFWQRWLRSVGL